MAKIKRGLLYLRKHGLKAFCKKSYEKIRLYYGISYRSWQRSHRLTGKQLKQQSQETFPYMPKISVILPNCRRVDKELEKSIKSVQEQTYGNWELILAGGGEKADAATDHEGMHPTGGRREAGAADEGEGLKTDAQDRRIKYFSELKQQTATEKMNVAVTKASGEYIAFLKAGDLLTRNALYECVKALNEKPETEFLYSDEDIVSGNRKKDITSGNRQEDIISGNRKKDAEPCFKPDFNLDLLRSLNYIGHLAVFHKRLWEKAGPLREDYKGAEEYDFILRCVEQTGNIYHIPKILYHELEVPKVCESEKRALEDHLERCGLSAFVIPEDTIKEKGKQQTGWSFRHVVYSCKDKPLVSIIIPNKDAVADLQKCLDSLEKKSTYRNIEYVIVENNSERQETFQYYRTLQKENPRVKVYRYKGGFNYSKINNFGVQKGSGDYLLLLNNDTELKAPDSIEEMLGICMRKDVGAVGAKLLYFDDTIQHAGVIIGAGGIAGHCFTGLPGDAAGYCGRAACVQDYNAVTAACLMTKRSVYEKLHGLREEFEVAFNDIDYCMQVRQQGGLVVYTPYAEFYHYESKTRGLDTEPEKKERFMGEIKLFEQLWPEILEMGDCYYNPNLSYKKADFALGL